MPALPLRIGDKIQISANLVARIMMMDEDTALVWWKRGRGATIRASTRRIRLEEVLPHLGPQALASWRLRWFMDDVPLRQGQGSPDPAADRPRHPWTPWPG